MNKLVSKNPILRFKLGKKILKFLNPAGNLPVLVNKSLPVQVPNSSNLPSVVKRSVPSTIRRVLPVAKRFIPLPLGRFLGPIGLLGSAYDMEQRRKEVADKLASGEYIVLNGHLVKNEAAMGSLIGSTIKKTKVRPSSKMTTPSLDYKQSLKSFIESGEGIGKVNGKPRLNTKPISTTTKISQSKSKNGWSYGFDRSKEGIGDIAAMQRKLKAEGYYADDENSRDDGKWGLSTENAYQRYLKKLKAMELPPEVQYIQNPIKVTPQPTPDFGYKTNNTYEDSDFSNRLKSMGIGSNADLIDFGWRTLGNDYDWKGNDWAKQFRSDINLALGGDWSDANIRKTFNTAGNWGRGFLGSGDISDFQKALLTNAGTWNGAYDRAKELYEANKPKLSPEYMKSIMDWFSRNGVESNRSTWRTLLNNRLSYYKRGGQLVSRNSILRFKSNFRLVAQ